jgi:hypothetical protein
LYPDGFLSQQLSGFRDYREKIQSPFSLFIHNYFLPIKKPFKNQMKVIAIIPAAGLGKRLGPDTNKPFLTLGGKPLIVWSLEQLEAVTDIIEIIPVLQLKDMEYGKKT